MIIMLTHVHNRPTKLHRFMIELYTSLIAVQGATRSTVKNNRIKRCFCFTQRSCEILKNFKELVKWTHDVYYIHLSF